MGNIQGGAIIRRCHGTTTSLPLEIFSSYHLVCESFPLVCVTFVERLNCVLVGDSFYFWNFIIWILYLPLYLSGLHSGMYAV